MDKCYGYIKNYTDVIDIEEISQIDFASKRIIQDIIQNWNIPNDTFLFKIQAVLDYMYEKINIGNWKDVNVHFRKTMTIASFLKLLIELKCNKEQTVTRHILKECFNIIDYGLLFGSPLEKEPKLLQNCAAVLNKAYNDILEQENNILSINLIKSPINKPTGKFAKEIECITCPSLEFFYSNYILKEVPLVLDNCIDHWPALKKWKDQHYLLKLAGLRTVPIELGTKYTDMEWTQKLMTLEDFIKNHIYNTNSTTGYLAQYQLFDHIPELGQDISIPDYCCFSDTESVVDVNAWFGPAGTVSPLHHDPKRNLLAQIIGEKNIFLFPPSSSEYLYPHEDELLNNTAKVDPREPDLVQYPLYIKASPLHCILKPGQMLYIPPKWWHFVESLSISFSVSYWWT